MREATYWGVLLAVGGAATPFVVLWFRHRALRRRVTAHRTITEGERESLRRQGHLSIISFVGFWVISLALVFAVSTLDASPEIQTLVLAAILALVVGGVWRQLSTRCPVCHYRLGYQRALGIPKRCERCGVSL